MKKIEEIQKVAASLTEDAEKFYLKGNKAAGTRVRKSMQKLKFLAQEVRVEVTEKKEKML